MKRMITCLAAAFAVGLFSLPASAATTGTTVFRGAEATWYSDAGGVGTGVLIRPIIARDQYPGANNQRTLGVNVQIARTFTDSSTGEEVTQVFVSDPYYAPATSITVDVKSGTAAVRAHVSLIGELGPAGSVDIAATWTPAASATKTVFNTWDTEGGMKLLQRSSDTVAPAVATGSMTGAFDYADLGPTDGVVRSTRTFAMFQAPFDFSMVGAMVDISAAELKSNIHITGATGNFMVGGEHNTEIDVSIEQNHNANGGTGASARVTVEQSYCDTAK
ncbi:MAG TPA: hypothetical protein VFJ24_07975, partial [Gaiellales bacterium]|nr:hypothetical protein [Gaiellales bacterium]